MVVGGFLETDCSLGYRNSIYICIGQNYCVFLYLVDKIILCFNLVYTSNYFQEHYTEFIAAHGYPKPYLVLHHLLFNSWSGGGGASILGGGGVIPGQTPSLSHPGG